MGADAKILRTRIKSLNSTLHLTKAMELVATSKIRRANEAMLRSREYMENLSIILNQLTSDPECVKNPYMRNEGSRNRLIVIAGDRGLAGGYNANVFRLAGEYSDEDVIPIGRRACDRYGKPFLSSEYFFASDAYALSKKLCLDFLNGEYDRLGIISTKYLSVITQKACIQWIFPLSRTNINTASPIVFEPDASSVFDIAIPEYVAGALIASIRESFACEIASRRIAMDNAGKNAGQMIDELEIQYNRARQGAITQEITEIIAGSGI